MESTFRKWSLLGLLLMAASAVVAAIFPAHNDDEPELVNGTLTWSTVGGEAYFILTCRNTQYPISICHNTFESATTIYPEADSFEFPVFFTSDNTTLWENLYW